MIVISITILIIYSILILFFVKGFYQVKLFTSDNLSPKSNFSIVIPFRNEAENLLELLQSISQINYPKNKFEIILINDDSNDNSVEIIEKFKIKLQKLEAKFEIFIINNHQKSNSPKKDAIETAIKSSKFDWIITTDADCILPTEWLKTIDQFIQKKSPKMIVGPVTYVVNNSFLDQFQLLDFISLIGSTIGSFGINKPFLCNGANLCYSKNVFKEVGKFDNNNNIASGDDIFLLEKIVNKYPDKVHFLKSQQALVITKPQPNFNKLLAQRLRWASKATTYTQWFGKFVGVSVFLMNLSIVILLILSSLNIIPWLLFSIILLMKFFVDFTLISQTLFFTKQSRNIIFYPITSVFYPFFNVFVVFLSIFKIKFHWKERLFSS
ncbi:MAG: glycosyltransferase [Flavobacteriaceae bacterium]|nr:glycosyltransferase [Flavobacteriaceae bacterium]